MRKLFPSRFKGCLSALFFAGALGAAGGDPVPVATLRERLLAAHQDASTAMDNTLTPRLHSAAMALQSSASRYDLLVARMARQGSITVEDLAAVDEAHGAAVAEYNDATEALNDALREVLAAAAAGQGVEIPNEALAAAAA